MRRPPIDGWLEERKDALKLRGDVLKEAAEWSAGGKSDKDLVRRGERLRMALELRADPGFANALVPAKGYFAGCQKLETAARRAARRTQAAILTLMLGVIAGLVGFINQGYLKEQWYWATKVRPYALTAAAETALKAKDPIKECADCPEMIVVPAGEFMMGSPESEMGRQDNEGPQHMVTIARSFAVGRFDVTFDEWDACFALGGCKNPAADQGWGRGQQPVISVSWNDAKEYVAWLTKLTEKPYRLLSEAEWEYAARAGSTTAYSFGRDPARVDDYGWFSENSENKAHPVGEKKPNAFGLYDMHGNLWQWCEDPYHSDYKDNPLTDGKLRQNTNPSSRVLRGGSFGDGPFDLRSAYRYYVQPDFRFNNVGFRVARTLLPSTP